MLAELYKNVTETNVFSCGAFIFMRLNYLPLI